MTDSSWHLDKKVPIGLIVTVIVQIVLIVIFFVKMDGRVEALEKQQIETSSNRFTSSDAALHAYKISQNREDITNIYTKLDMIQRDISAIKIAVGADAHLGG